MILAPSGICTRTVFNSISAPTVAAVYWAGDNWKSSAGADRRYSDRIPTMIRYYTAMGLQLLGLILTGDALLLYFGQLGPLMRTASLGAGWFCAGWLIRPRERCSGKKCCVI